MTIISIADGQKVLAAARDSLGCSMKLSRNEIGRAGALTLLRKSAKGMVQTHVETPAQERGMIVGMSLLSGHRRKIREGSRRSDRVFDRHSIYIREFDVDYAACVQGAFDFFLIEMPPDAPRLRPTSDATDAKLGAIAQHVCGWLERPDLYPPLYAQEVGEVITDHLMATHALRHPSRHNSRLSAAQVVMAKELLMSDDVERLHLSDLAATLDLPRNRFFRGFREATGASPYQWLMDRRIEHARLLMRIKGLSLAEIALTCGFSDQSHFTRVFQRSIGISPGRWRRGC